MVKFSSFSIIMLPPPPGIFSKCGICRSQPTTHVCETCNFIFYNLISISVLHSDEITENQFQSMRVSPSIPVTSSQCQGTGVAGDQILGCHQITQISREINLFAWLCSLDQTQSRIQDFFRFRGLKTLHAFCPVRKR